MSHRESVTSVIVSQLLLRTASAAGALIVGSYFVDLAHHGVGAGSMLLGILSGLSYVAELVFSPISGAISDRIGRRPFLVLAPLLAAAGALLTPGASVLSAAPPLILVAVVVSVARFVDGAGAAIAVPSTLGFIADATDADRMRRGRITSMFELSSSGGIALGAVVGPLLYRGMGLWAFAGVALLYAAASVLVVVFVSPHPVRPRPMRSDTPCRVRLSVLKAPRLLAFLPAWIAVNAILGTWITAQITFVLAGDRHLPGQHFTGTLAGHEQWLSAILGGYVLVFSACIVGWAFLVGRMPTIPTLFITVLGSVIASIGLMLANHGFPLAGAVPIVIVGVFLEAGFTPAALAHLSEISAVFAKDRGLIMGVYSVVLGIGYLLGNVLGGLFAAWDGFDGLGWLTITLGFCAAAAIAAMFTVERRHRNSLPAVPVTTPGQQTLNPPSGNSRP